LTLAIDPSSLPHRPRRVELSLPRGPLALWCPAGADELLDALVDAPPDPDDKMPYWADLWPAAIGLAQAIDLGALALEGREALELGAGLGLVSLAAARGGARAIATDWDEDALRYVAASAAENALDVRTERLDWRAPPPRRYEVLLAADVLYEARNAPAVAHALEALLAPGGVAWLSDPGRRFVPDFFRALVGFRVATTRVDVVAPQVPQGRATIDLYRLERSA
jgi:predicted nicotinamide N-methyase